MDYRLLNLLMKQVICDIREFIPKEYFNPCRTIEPHSVNKSISIAMAVGLSPDSSTDKVRALRAAELGAKILRQDCMVNARQHVACELLIPLGEVIVIEIYEKINQTNTELEFLLVPSAQLNNIKSLVLQKPTVINNFQKSLKEYLKFSTEQEAKTFISLLEPDPEQSNPQAAVSAAKDEDLPRNTKTNKTRRNILDPAIEKAINKAGNTNLADVYLHLKELAKDESPPFNGSFNQDALIYTNDNDELAELSKEALRKRLKRRQSKPLTDVK